MKRPAASSPARIRRRRGVVSVTRPAERIRPGTEVAWENRTGHGVRSYVGHVVQFIPAQRGEPGDVHFDHYEVRCGDRVRCVPASVLEAKGVS